MYVLYIPASVNTEKLCINVPTNARLCGRYISSLVSLAWTHLMLSFPICIVLFFTLSRCFLSCTCSDSMSIVQVAFVNPLINELCVYACMHSTTDYRSADCSILKTAVPQLAEFLEDPPSCTVRRRGIELNDGGRKCTRAELISNNVFSNATCRVNVSAVS